MILPCYLAVGRDRHNLQTIDFGKFTSFRHCRARHAGQLVIHTKIILEGDRRQRLVFRLNFNFFFGFNGLVQTI